MALNAQNSFDAFLQKRWAELDITQTEFARRLGENKARVSVIRRYPETGKTPPLDDMDDWANALELTGERREYFITLAHLAHTTDRIVHLVEKLEASAQQEREQIVKLTAENRMLESTLKMLEKRVAELAPPSAGAP